MAGKLKTFTFGGGRFSKMSPLREDLTSNTKALNFTMSFEEALKLGVAVQESIRHLNAMNRATKEGRDAGFNIVFYLDTGQFAVTRGMKVTVRPRSRPKLATVA